MSRTPVKRAYRTAGERIPAGRGVSHDPRMSMTDTVLSTVLERTLPLLWKLSLIAMMPSGISSLVSLTGTDVVRTWIERPTRNAPPRREIRSEPQSSQASAVIYLPHSVTECGNTMTVFGLRGRRVRSYRCSYMMPHLASFTTTGMSSMV